MRWNYRRFTCGRTAKISSVLASFVGHSPEIARRHPGLLLRHPGLLLPIWFLAGRARCPLEVYAVALGLVPLDGPVTQMLDSASHQALPPVSPPSRIATVLVFANLANCSSHDALCGFCSDTGAVVGAVIGSLLFVALVVGAIWWCRRRRVVQVFQTVVVAPPTRVVNVQGACPQTVLNMQQQQQQQQKKKHKKEKKEKQEKQQDQQQQQEQQPPQWQQPQQWQPPSQPSPTVFTHNQLAVASAQAASK